MGTAPSRQDRNIASYNQPQQKKQKARAKQMGLHLP
jgi:hypothetical protein